jgi:hypothetical protein
MVFDLFARPVKAADVIVERSLYGVHVRGAEPLV